MKLAMLLSYMGFLRQSNLAPRTANMFDNSRHTTRGDIQQTNSATEVFQKFSGLEAVPQKYKYSELEWDLDEASDHGRPTNQKDNLSGLL